MLKNQQILSIIAIVVIVIVVIIIIIRLQKVDSFSKTRSFAQRLYGEKFMYPPYLNLKKQYNLPVSKERKVKSFGNLTM